LMRIKLFKTHPKGLRTEWEVGVKALVFQAGREARQQAGEIKAARIEYRHVNGVQRILDQQPKIGIAFHDQAPGKEQRVRIFLAPRQQQEVLRAGGD